MGYNAFLFRSVEEKEKNREWLLALGIQESDHHEMSVFVMGLS